MPDPNAPLSHTVSDAESISLRQYIDLQIVSMTADVRARREGMAAEELSYRASLAHSDAQWRSMHEKVHDELEKLAQRDKETGMYIWQTAQTDYKIAHVALEKLVADVRVGADRALHDCMEAHTLSHTHLESEIVLLRQQAADSLAASVRAHETEHARAREAEALSESKLDKRLDSMNEIRASLRDAQLTYVTRDAIDDYKKAQSDRLDTVISTVNSRIEAQTTAFAGQITRVEAALVDLQTSRANQAGRATAMSTVIGIASFIAAMLVSIGLHFIKS